MKRNIMKYLGIGSLCLFLLGCTDKGVLLNTEQIERSEIISEEIAEENQMDSGTDSVQEEKEAADPRPDHNEQSENEEELAVHICGAVNQPGVYILKGTSRVYEGIQKAGGFTEEAARDYLNLALLLEDGMKITVPTQEEVLQWQTGSQEEISEQGMNEENWLQKNEDKTTSAEGRININTADVKELMTLPGIGESRAASIIEYREQKGSFKTIEDIMNVTGIKEAAYEKIKEQITVS